LHFKQIELPPFAMWPDFPVADYYEDSVSMVDIRVNSLGIPSCLPSFICWTFTRWGGCRSQSLSLRPASRCRCHGLAAFSPWLHAGELHVRPHSGAADIRLRRHHQHSAC